ncbi:MAG: UDP-N-acetylmuramyl-tripeptide synthetase [Parcubacteria group bacterium]|nr:UDP-N-acetylmuramyl-tripeptide synthetase [Parcubacteria group bacterium]
MDTILFQLKKLIPQKLFSILQPIYHYALALFGALVYRFPSRKIIVVGVTGTKGKTSVIELTNALLEHAGYKTALLNTVRYKIDDESYDNKFKMTMPGRLFVQSLLRKAVQKKCQYALIEMTSEGARQYRHKFIAMDALIFTNLAPEHIESHGSYEKYREAKLSIAKALAASKKARTIMVANKDDNEGGRFLNVSVKEKYPYALPDAEPYEISQDEMWFTFGGARIQTRLRGRFNLYNILAALTFAKSQNVSTEVMKRAIESFNGIPGRMESITLPSTSPLRSKQDFVVVVDYAHTPDSLAKVYDVFQHSRKICVLGATGGGRDRWKRKEMGRIAGDQCTHVILTNEDPYDENPRDIVEDVASGMTQPIYRIIMDRREAIREALKEAETSDTVIITGKGTDPYIMGPNNTKLPWSDARVAREELERVLQSRVSVKQ